MAVLPRVFCSGAIVATVEDVDIHLLTVESWSDRVLVRTVGALTEPVQAVVAADMARSGEWRRRAGAGGPPPEPVAERLARSLTVELTDDSGTAFTLVARSSGGAYESGSALYCEWVFMPAMPGPATRLTVTVRTGDRHATTRTFGAGPAPAAASHQPEAGNGSPAAVVASHQPEAGNEAPAAAASHQPEAGNGSPTAAASHQPEADNGSAGTVELQ
jgi:hypothetical protein